MFRQLQLRADDLAECLLVAELEMRRSRALEKRLEAFLDFGRIVNRIDSLRCDAEELHSKDELLAPLDRKVARIMRSDPYRIAEWFQFYNDAGWYIGPATVDPMRQVTPC